MITTNDILNVLFTPAYAETTTAAATQPPAGGGLSLFLMLGIFIVFMYFTMWLPQRKRAKEHRDLMGGLTKGDEVVTAGGILGKISKVTEQYVVLSIADNLEMTVQKNSIVSALPKGTLKSI